MIAPDRRTLKGQENCSCLVTPADMKKTYAMAESEAYFEAYRHVLAGLQETAEIPLRQYIVDCAKLVDSPRYLRGLAKEATYDFSCIIAKKGDSKANHTYDVLKTHLWPNAKTLGLDLPQVSALKSALTHELSIIQGPPGTGKTYLGLMIMKLLLANRNDSAVVQAERQRGKTLPPKTVPDGPILVVCYTNHALDQFLEGIARFHPKGLIRVGGRGKNKELEKYNLANVRRHMVNDRRSSSDKLTRKTFFDLRRDLETQISAVEESQAILKASTDSILGLSVLETVMASEHYKEFEDEVNCLKAKGVKVSDNNDILLRWLGVSKKAYSIPDMMSFIIEETLEVVVKHYEPHGISRNKLMQAIACTKSLDHELLIPCFMEHSHDEFEPLINSDIVCKFLENYEILFDMEMFNGLHPLEVKCSCFVLASNEFHGIPITVQTIIGWIKRRRAVTAEDVGFMEDAEEEVGANVEEEANYVQDRRMIDGGEDEFMMHIEKKGRRQPTKLKKKNITAAKHDDLHFLADFGVDLQDGFEMQRGQRKNVQRKMLRRMRKELTKLDCMGDAEAVAVVSVKNLTSDRKWKLYRYWVKKLLSIHRKNISKRSVKYNSLTKDLNAMRSREAFEVLQRADVIAMTTTGAAKYRDMIYELPIRIMIVEEAAEVLEAHIVTSMPKITQHLILIGDHQQLKPSPTVYDLATKYNLDMSLFERMVNNGISCSRLELQHRMRPRIADLIRPHIYKVLRDHESVMTYDDVMGMRSNVFFLSHDHLEDNVTDSKSKVNQHEADFMIELCRYLLQQGYLPEQITILTAYVGQLFAFKKALARKLSSRVRITAVDNFQGEENDIILLSLVRSNEQGKIGFLSIENRVCVALSRAKKALYCIGNFELLKHKSELWRKILSGLEEKDLTGDSMPLQCKNHPETIIQVKCQEDFKKVPEGGCGKPCTFPLNCGHVCAKLCHPIDMEHKKYICRKQMEKECPNGHKTKLKCNEKLHCKVLVEKPMPKCEHHLDIACSIDPETVTCSKPCEKILACGHNCKNICGMKCVTSCMETIKMSSPCGHRVKVACSKKAEFKLQNCGRRCNKVLKCGHVCRGTCGKCKQGRLHVGCKHPKCGKVLCCGHICREKCTSACPPCRGKCETSCGHGECKKLCSEPCVLCTKECEWKCKHYSCTNLCSEPCNRPPCNKPCKKLLICGHYCIGLCGEPCPKLCRICDKEKVEEIFFGDENKADARFVQLGCGHIFTHEGLDEWMVEKNFDDKSDTKITLKECPRCKTLIRNCTRYGNIVNKTLIAINQVREKIAGKPEVVNKNGQTLLESIQKDALFKTHYSLHFEELIKTVKAAKTNPALSVIELQYDCLSEFASIKDKLQPIKTNLLISAYIGDLITPFTQFYAEMKDIETWLMRQRCYFSEQEKEDLNQERQRSRDIFKFIQIEYRLGTRSVLNSQTDSIQETANEITRLIIEDVFPYHASKQEQMTKIYEKLDALMPSLLPSLEVLKEKRQLIVKAINLSHGPWFKCPNGHVYCAEGEFEGVMEKSKCPECKPDSYISLLPGI